MADSKRNSMGGNRSGASTPKTNSTKEPAASGPGELDFNKVIGARIKITMTAPTSQTVEGIVYTADSITNLIALNTNTTASAAASSSYMIIPVSRIQSFSLVAAATPVSTDRSASATGTAAFENVGRPVTKIDINALKAREANAIKKMKERDAMIGKGVTEEAQEIFDALSRTLPTRWHESTIIVNDNVIIKPPYTSEDCSAPKAAEASLVRVRRVLENERRKILERTGVGAVESNGQPTTPASSVSKSPATALPNTARGSGSAAPVVATPLPRKGG